MTKLKAGWKKFLTLNGASMFIAMIVIIILFEIIMQIRYRQFHYIFNICIGNR